MFKKYWIVEFPEKWRNRISILCNVEMKTNLDIDVVQMFHLLLACSLMKIPESQCWADRLAKCMSYDANFYVLLLKQDEVINFIYIYFFPCYKDI